MSESYKQLIDRWPSLEAFAQDVRVKCNTAKQMRLRDSVPSEYWLEMVASAERRQIAGVTLDALATIAAARRAPVLALEQRQAA